jgi:hypothetical protein
MGAGVGLETDRGEEGGGVVPTDFDFTVLITVHLGVAEGTEEASL